MIYLKLSPKTLLVLDEKHQALGQHIVEYAHNIDKNNPDVVQIIKYSIDIDKNPIREFYGSEATELYEYYFNFLAMRGITVFPSEKSNDPALKDLFDKNKSFALEIDEKEIPKRRLEEEVKLQELEVKKADLLIARLKLEEHLKQLRENLKTTISQVIM